MESFEEVEKKGEGEKGVGEKGVREKGVRAKGVGVDGKTSQMPSRPERTVHTL